MVKTQRIPKFQTIAEEARFWDTHDAVDYLPEMKEVEMVYAPSVPKEETLTIRVQTALKRRLEKIARSYGVNLSTLLRIWFIDKAREAESSRLAG